MQNLPSFVTIHPGPDARNYGSAFLPAAHQGTKLTVPVNDAMSAIEDLRNASGSDAIQRTRIDLTQRLNRRLLDQLHDDAGMQGVIESMELAFRMHATTPAVLDISRESAATLEL